MIDLLHAITHLDAAAALGMLADAAPAATEPPAPTGLVKVLMDWIANAGIWAYAIMFSVIFAETGFLIFPFLPGDTFLILIGLTCVNAQTNIHWYIVIPLLISAAILGNFTNYSIGRAVGPRLFKSEKQDTLLHRALSKDKLDKTHAFFDKHGGKAITFAQFIPGLRCLVPFVAGLGQMNRRRFVTFNCVGAIAWISTFVTLGMVAGNELKKYETELVLGMLGVVAIIIIAPFALWLFKCLRRPAPISPATPPIKVEP